MAMHGNAMFLLDVRYGCFFSKLVSFTVSSVTILWDVYMICFKPKWFVMLTL